MSGLSRDAVVSTLPEAELAAFCTWTTAQAKAYEQSWTRERTCTFVGARLASSSAAADLAAARRSCAMLRDTCLDDEQAVIVLPCSALSTCGSTVGQVEAYFITSRRVAEQVTTCDALAVGALDDIPIEALSVLPSCTLVGVPK
jgi:hypothetical protein